MTWDEALATLNLGQLRAIILRRVLRAGLSPLLHPVEGLLVDTLWESWRCFDQYDPTLSSFQTWVVYYIFHTVDWHRRRAAWTIPFSRLSRQMLECIPDPRPMPEEYALRAEEAVMAEELIQRIEIAIEVFSRKRTRKTNLAVFRTYRQLLTESTQVKVNQADVAERMGVPHQTISVVMKRIADICEKCGLRV